MANTIFPVRNLSQTVSLNVGTGGTTRFRFVKLSSGSAVACGSNERALGVALTTESASASAEIALAGLQPVELGGTVAALGLVKSDSVGRAVAADDASVGGARQNVLGLALTGGSSGDIVQLLLTPGASLDLDALLQADLALTTEGHGASRVGLYDGGGRYAATNIEAALAEAAANLEGLESELASTATGDGAAKIGVEDAGGYTSEDDVEACLQELYAAGQDFVVEFCHARYLGEAFPQDITADLSGALASVAHRSLAVRDVILSVENTGEDAANDLAVEADVKIGGTSCLSTKPKIDKSAADGSNTAAAGTGKTQAVVDANNADAAAGDRVTVDLTLTRTATPTDEMAGVRVIVVCGYRLPF